MPGAARCVGEARTPGWGTGVDGTSGSTVTRSSVAPRDDLGRRRSGEGIDTPAAEHDAVVLRIASDRLGEGAFEETTQDVRMHRPALCAEGALDLPGGLAGVFGDVLEEAAVRRHVETLSNICSIYRADRTRSANRTIRTLWSGGARRNYQLHYLSSHVMLVAEKRRRSTLGRRCVHVVRLSTYWPRNLGLDFPVRASHAAL